MNSHVVPSLDRFIQRFMQQHETNRQPMQVEWEENWPSPCQQGQVDANGKIAWQPVKREDVADFSASEAALELPFHPDFKAFFARYWSANLPASAERGRLELLQVWNPDDFARLQQNLIGHVLMKRRLRHPETLFFAVTDDDDYILSLENQSGQVMLERVGVRPREILAQDLASFLDGLSP
ncbi:SecY-interacting protein [Bowmanella dokdonensis]|uniref:Protein Syd n=1 Tax=Bowmanella dokdonensis TaxID=751969 RepID=A0A939DMH2_9ALTE|nr:SecY-interacting protein [Bowmanella dokdonensis]MBN7824830.1 SecY-interacting protein [Bowmanella dokdonensis]